MFCPACGRVLSFEDKFCRQCGHEVDQLPSRPALITRGATFERPLKGVYGWLWVLVIWLVFLRPAGAVGYLGQVIYPRSIEMSTYVSTYPLFVWSDIAASVLLSGWGVVVGIDMWLQKPGVLDRAVEYFVVAPLFYVLGMYAAYPYYFGYGVGEGAPTFGADDIGVIVRAVLPSIGWGLYLAYSQRVRLTFGPISPFFLRL